MRDDLWLNNKLDQIWELLFPEVEKRNKISVRFKGRWKNKFGHIKKLKNENTEIAVNSLFKNEIVPEFIIELTLAHELVHYYHGFQSPYNKKFSKPHKGGVVRKELINRGFGHLLRKEREWVKDNWIDVYKELCPEKVRRFRFFN